MKRMPKWIVAAIVSVSATTMVATSVAAAPAPRSIPRAPWGAPSNIIEGAARSVFFPSRDPVAANNYSCRPSSAHPNPVVLVHGTAGNAYDSWSGLAPVLRSYGYCVFAVNYGAPSWYLIKGLGDIPASAAEIGRFVDRVLARTGKTKVDLVGHSQGGSVARYYANLIGGSSKVASVTGLAPSNHSTNLSGLVNLARFVGIIDPFFSIAGFLGAPALQQQADPNSTFYRNLNGNGETRPGIRYTNIATRYDEVVTPYTQAFITAGPGATVKNITLQNVCSNDYNEHIGITYDTNVYQMILNSLDPADQRPISCRLVLPVFGG